MSDFEGRVTRGLTVGAEDAPSADGLAGRARARAGRRRRRAVATAAAAVVAAIVVPLAVTATWDSGSRGRGQDVSSDGVGDPGPGWHTVVVDDEAAGEQEESVVIDLPDAWTRLDTSACEFARPRFGPDGTDPCDGDGSGAWVVGSRTLDTYLAPGVHHASDYPVPIDAEWSGHVGVGDRAVLATGSDLTTVRRVLASARLGGDPAPDLSGEWPVLRDGGLEYAVPRGRAVTVGYAVVRGGPAQHYGSKELASGLWRASKKYSPGSRLIVTAPTQALAEVVAYSATPYVE
jgi:hypothetical protein